MTEGKQEPLKAKEKKKRSAPLYLINRDFQLRYARAAVTVGISSTILTATLILYPLYVFEILRIPKFLPMPILFSMIFAAVLNVAFVAIMTISLTHKIAGPMFALVREFRRVGLGSFTKQLSLRQGDELKYAVRNFNEMVESLEHLSRDDLKIIQDALQAVESDSVQEQKLVLLKERIEKRVIQQVPKTGEQAS